MTYRAGTDGRQFVVVTAGAEETASGDTGDFVVAFSLQ